MLPAVMVPVPDVAVKSIASELSPDLLVAYSKVTSSADVPLRFTVKTMSSPSVAEASMMLRLG